MRRAAKTIAAAILAGTMTFALTACGATGTASESTSAAVSAAYGKTYKVGIVQFVDDASLNQIEKNVEKELDAKAKELGVNFDYKDYTFNGQADGTVLQQIASQLVSDKVDLIIPIATPTAQIMQTATKKNPIPIVFSACSDPVGAQLVKSMEAPGANITGTSDALNTEAIMELIFAQDPDTDYVGLLYSNSEDASEQAIKDAKSYLDKKGVKYIEKTGTDTTGVTDAANALIAEGVDVVFTPTDNTVMTAELAIYKSFAKAGIKHYAGADSFALNGAFCGYGVDYANLGNETADMAVDILVKGADPAKTPVKTFDNGIAKVNTDVAEQLGLDLKEIKKAFGPHCTKVSGIKTDKSFAE
jgi:putative ABC transport system substrate-binding protein